MDKLNVLVLIILSIMKDYSKAYKAYDIRSVYQEPVDASFAFSLGKGLGKYLFALKGEEATFLFGSDVRLANNELVYRFAQGLKEGGVRYIVNCGISVGEDWKW